MKEYAMKSFVSKVFLAAVVAMVGCGPASQPSTTQSTAVSASAANRKTAIHMTKNHLLGKPGQKYETTCIGVVATDLLTAKKNDKISWKIKNGSGEDSVDDCPGYDASKVELHFASTDPMGNMVLTATGSNIDGQVMAAAEGKHKYVVYYVNSSGAIKQAGPDPEIIVNCDSCGPAGEGGPSGGGAP
jgi:hypothetical protein